MAGFGGLVGRGGGICGMLKVSAELISVQLKPLKFIQPLKRQGPSFLVPLAMPPNCF